MTAEDLLDPSVPEKFVELIEGELIVMTPANWRHGDIALNIIHLFEGFCAVRKELQYCADNNGFLIARGPDSVLSPDAALFRRRPPSETPWREFSPEAVVEIRSPANSRSDMALKRHRYFEAGTEQFWLVYPEERTIEFYHLDGKLITATGAAIVDGEGIAAGMRIDLTEVFKER
jgi:Uma2 family endonuclease